jgi:hypothetical protein
MPEHQISTSSGGPQKKMIARYADTVGNGSGTNNFIGNYAAAAEQAILTAGGKEDYVISRLIVSVYAVKTFTAQIYASVAQLTNGIEVKHIAADGTTVLNDLTDGVPVTTNSEWGALCYDADVKSWGAGNEMLLVRWTFAKAGQDGINVSEGESLRVFLEDNHSGLLGHRFMFQGYHSSLFD